jgi:hypothetical protein
MKIHSYTHKTSRIGLSILAKDLLDGDCFSFGDTVYKYRRKGSALEQYYPNGNGKGLFKVIVGQWFTNKYNMDYKVVIIECPPLSN